MGRQNYLVTTFSEIALEQFQMLKENYQKLEMLHKMCSEAVELKHEICSNYVITITFAAMSLEAFLNDYAAQNLGDDYFYENFDNLRPFAKLQLISKIVYNSTVDKSGKVYSFMNLLFRERNNLVHCKSREIVGMSEEEYIEFQQFLETDENANEWMIAERERLNIDEEKDLLDNALIALRALKEVANFIDEHDNSAYAASKLVCSGWYIDSDKKKYALIKSAQNFLEVRPTICPDEE